MSFRICALLFVSYSTIIAVSGLPSSRNEDCLTQCTDEFYQVHSRIDPVSMLNMETIQVPDEGPFKWHAVECPRMNNSAKLERSCGPYRTAKQCIDACPDSDAKTTLLNSYSSLQFMCIDRIDDWKGYTPCLFENCVEIQGACTPKCGSFKNVIKRVTGLLQNTNEQIGSGNSTALDMENFATVLSESCSRLYCFKDCSKEITKNVCGTGAWIMNVDIQWATLTSMFYSLRQSNLKIDWPLECKTLAQQL